MLTSVDDLRKPEEERKALRNSIYRARKQVEKQTENLILLINISYMRITALSSMTKENPIR